MLAGGLLFLFCAGVAWAQVDPAEEIEDDPAYASMRLLANAIQLIRQDYVDEERVDYEKLVQSALRGMLAELDPHSQFLDQAAFKAMQEDTRSEFGGLGIQVGLRNGHLVVVAPMEGTPAFEAGLLPGDRIVKIEGKTTDRLTLPEAVDMLRGEVGEKITLTIQRPPDLQIMDFTLERAVIKVKSVRDPMLLPAEQTGGRKIGYVRLSAFSEPTARELGEALDQLEEEGAEGLILDLRFNPGGLLTSAIDVCAQFLPAGTEVVSTAGRTPGRPFQTSSNASRDRRIPLVILINSSSASGAEIVAGALRDLGRAVLIGETTFGKGSVQGVSSMGDGSAIRLTTATYLTPSRQPIHEVGVRPHIFSVLTPAEERALVRHRQRLDSPEAGETPPARVVDPGKDGQLLRGVEVMQGLLLARDRVNQAQTVTTDTAGKDG
jgi:carboxyl-terminal processing protease